LGGQDLHQYLLVTLWLLVAQVAVAVLVLTKQVAVVVLVVIVLAHLH
jgi:hypothetical protein